MRELTKAEMDSMLGRLVSSYGITHTVLKVEPLPYGSVRLYIATDKKNGQWEGHWVPAHMVSEPGHTILHWHWRTDFREKPEECERLYSLAAGNVARRAEEARKKAAADAALRAEREAELCRIKPGWAKAVIIARLHEDRSDPVSDYFDSRIVREVLLGFSKTTRENFSEMRKAAAQFPETAALAGSEGEERREKYSMGRGYYLKRKGVSYHSGWEVRKHDLSYSYPVLELDHWYSLRV